MIGLLEATLLPRVAWLLPAGLLLAGCSSTPVMEIEIDSIPSGARVSIQLRGERNYVGRLGPLSGNLSARRFEDEFVSIGTTPASYATPLRETTTDATFLWVGGRAIRHFEDALVRFELEGYETVEKFVYLRKGNESLVAELTEVAEE